jgi:poly-beta-hydroxyalkanoate depolymerase
MDTEASPGYLTDFARQMGPDYIERLIQLFGKTVTDPEGQGSREVYDGRFQVLGFYLLGLDQHLRNFRQMYADMKRGNPDAAQRQKSFYLWYNYVLHFPAGFIRDTFQKIFVNNELIRGKLAIHGQPIGIRDYPSQVPIWALGGNRDDIAPPLQATSHMQQVDVAPDKKLTLICDGGHMGLFRSQKVLDNEYRRIRDFILANSDTRGERNP